MSDPAAHPGAEAGGAAHAHMSPAQAYEAAKLGIWTFLATEVLLFGGLFTAFIVFRLKFPEMFRADYVHLNRVMGAVNTVVLICSSLTVALGIAAIRKGKQGLLKLFLSLTILLLPGPSGKTPKGLPHTRHTGGRIRSRCSQQAPQSGSRRAASSRTRHTGQNGGKSRSTAVMIQPRQPARVPEGVATA